MKNNFDFLEEVDKDLYSTIIDAQNLFCSGYFNQCCVNVRIFGEKMAQKILPNQTNSTFDDILNCLKDRIKTQKERELIEDLFFIKQQGNKAAHGESLSSLEALEVLKRAFEASINYCYHKTKNEKIEQLLFDTNLLISNQKSIKEKIVEAKKDNKENQIKKVEKKEKKKEIKEKIKQARKNLKQNINKEKKPPKKQNNNLKLRIIFLIFAIISILLLSRMIFPFLFL